MTKHLGGAGNWSEDLMHSLALRIGRICISEDCFVRRGAFPDYKNKLKKLLSWNIEKAA